MVVKKSVRFEVFKRDSFTCQYCGAKAPEVVLHVDHIKPRSKGGSDDIINLITSCKACNLGKGAKQLSDDSAVKQRQAQAEALQERREQIQMMVEWHEALQDIDNLAVEELVKYWNNKLAGFELSHVGEETIRKLHKQYGFQEIIEAMDASANQYLDSCINEDGESVHTDESVGVALKKIGAICYIKKYHGDTPKVVYSIRKTLQNRFGAVDNRRYFALISEFRKVYDDVRYLDKLYKIAKDKEYKSTAMFFYAMQYLIEEKQKEIEGDE